MNSNILFTVKISLCVLLFVTAFAHTPTVESNSEPYKADWESLKQYQVPTWFRDAKFGIFIHWGPYVVPKYLGPFYGYHMYREQLVDIKGNPNPNRENTVFQHHRQHYGGSEKFGYKDFIPLFRGENFSAKRWVDLFVRAGAQYIVPVAEHCDGFAMYHSTVTRWNAVNMGPKKDIVGELFTEARNRNIKVGMSSHFAYGWYWWGYREGTDTVDPKYEDFYGKPHKITDPHSADYVDLWFRRTQDMMKTYKPDLLWFDLGFSNPEYASARKQLLADYYNQAYRYQQEVVLNYKNITFKPIPDGAAVLDIESGKLDRIRKEPWQTDMSLGGWRWSYTDQWQTMPTKKLIGDLIDIVSKNGNLLLNVAPDAKGDISSDQIAVLEELGHWLKINGEGIYGSRPFDVFGQGPTNAKMVLHGNLKEKDYTPYDIRYTRKGQIIYAYLLDWPATDKTVQLYAFGSEQRIVNDAIKSISLLANGKKVVWQQTVKSLVIELPKKRPDKYAVGFKIELEPVPDDIF